MKWLGIALVIYIFVNCFMNEIRGRIGSYNSDNDYYDDYNDGYEEDYVDRLVPKNSSVFNHFNPFPKFLFQFGEQYPELSNLLVFVLESVQVAENRYIVLQVVFL